MTDSDDQAVTGCGWGGGGRPSHAASGHTAGGHCADDALLAERLSDLARTLESADDVEQTLDAIVHAAVGTVPGAEHASITAIKQRTVTSPCRASIASG
jgi:hypothetical protein